MKRILATSVAILISAGLTACSDDDDANTNGNSPIGSADLSDPATVRAQAGQLAQMIGSLSTVERTLSPAGARKTIENGECDSGSVMSYSASAQDVGSPFTDQTFDLTGETADDCRLTGNLDNGDTNNDYLEVDGQTASGTVTEGSASVSYAAIGESSETPYRLRYHLDSEQQGSTNVVDIDYGIRVRVDSSDDGSTGASDERLIFNLGGGYSVAGTANGQSFSSDGSFESYLGTDDAPFRVLSDASGTLIDGPTGFAISPEIPQAGCANAASEIATTDALIDSASGVSPFSGGTIEITSGGATASVTFNSDDTVTLTADGGAAETVDYAQLLAAAGACSGIALSGLAFLGGL